MAPYVSAADPIPKSRIFPKFQATPFTPLMRFAKALLRPLLVCFGCVLLPLVARGEPVDFNLPAQSAADALLAFSQQAKVEILFSFDKLRKVQSNEVIGRLEAEAAIVRLLAGTGFTTHRNAKGKFVVTSARTSTGSIKGALLNPDGTPARNLHVTLSPSRQSVRTDQRGEYQFLSVRPGTYKLTVTADGYQPFQSENFEVTSGSETVLAPKTAQRSEDVTRLDPYVVTGETDGRPFDRSETPFMKPTAVGNLDLPRTENDALPFTIYDREQITRSGVVDLNGFLQRAVLESDAGTTPPEQNGNQASYDAGSTNLNLRGYGADETVILVNGRRLPEVMTSFSGGSRSVGPDVNFIPLSLVQQVEVLPVSSSALYSGNAFGGVINIVLRTGEKSDATEISTNYTNALASFDAPQSSVSLLHSQTLLAGKIHLLLSANFTKSEPPTEAELGYFQAHDRATPALSDPIYRATPNIRSADMTPLFGPGSSPVTSVAPGADGNGGLAAFAGRQGVRNLDFFQSPGGLVASPNSLEYPYGRQQRRSAYFGSATYDLFPWLQVGLDATYVSTIVNRGFDVFAGNLSLKASSPFNPFGQDINVSLNELAPNLGPNYSEAHLDFSSAVLGLLVKLPADWRISADAQYAHNVAKYRGLADADGARWQQLVDNGTYNPLRDTQTHGPPQEFYDRALIYYGAPGRFVTLGDYDTEDAAVRVTNQSLALPMGSSTINFGADYRRVHLAGYSDTRHYADGTQIDNPVDSSGRTLQRYSVFGELQTPVVPSHWLPGWLRKLEADLAVRYVAADSSKETNVAPTFGLKAEVPWGLSFRGSFTTSNRVPTPQLSRPIISSDGSGGGINLVNISDPMRGGEEYSVKSEEALNPDLSTEAAVTQTAGLIFQRGKVHQFRASLDFVDTRKTNEVKVLDEIDVLNLETLFPERVTRAPLAPGDTHAVGQVTSLLTGPVNLASRHSQNWNTSLDYAWTECAHGTLSLYSRLVYFQRFDVKVFPNSPAVDELNSPDGAASILKYRANFGAGWSNPQYGFGVDGHYYHSRTLPATEWAGQGGTKIDPYWQYDVYIQSDLKRFMPWKSSHYGLRGQFRINNVFGTSYPEYAGGGGGAGVQPYGDWRGRTYSVSLTATF
jgi:outer membrane receptor protein involved in Fe transport